MDGSMEKRKLGPIQLDSYQPLREVVCETLRDAVRRGDIRPARTGERTRWYSVTEINAYEAQQRALARIQLDTIITKS